MLVQHACTSRILVLGLHSADKKNVGPLPMVKRYASGEGFIN